MTQTTTQLDPESLVARIIAELEANPDAQRMLLNALLSQEFLGMPTRLERIENEVLELTRRVRWVESQLAEIKGNLVRLDERVGRLEADVADLKVDVGDLKGDSLEFKLPRRVRPLLSQRLGLRRPRIMQSLLVAEDISDLSDPVYDAYESGRITLEQENRILATDLILRARRAGESGFVWIAVEASATVKMRDISRARDSADVLATVFGEDAIAAVCGYAIRTEDERRAKEMGVEVVIVESSG